MIDFISQIHEKWLPAFNYTEETNKKLNELYKSGPVTPEPEFLFASFTTPPEEIECIVLGQDPYPNGIGVGYAFAYKDGVKKPWSFKVIEQELGTELSNSLQEWKDIGVVSVNAALTTIIGKPGSHRELWKTFTIKWLKYLNKVNKNVTYLFLGRVAQFYADYVESDKKFYAPHPATRHHNFVGCGIFNKFPKFKTIKN